jgi:hypothetical protein
VDVPTLHSADPLIFPLPKHFCGRVNCPDEKTIFFFCKPGLFSRTFRLVWLKEWNNIPRLLFYPFQDNQFKKMPSASQNTDAMVFPGDGTDPIFFGAEQPASVHCFDCCLDSAV